MSEIDEQTQAVEDVQTPEPEPEVEVQAPEADAAAAVDTSAYTDDDIRAQIKPLSDNGFVRFFQKILRWWLGVWYGFCDKKPKFSAILYKVFFFFVFSMGVTIWQFIVMAVVPLGLPKTDAVGWPNVPIGAAGGLPFIIFGDPQGWAIFICFEIAVFTAQCINFPLQRNITYRSHGNPWWQAMWYFIGWVLVSIATNAIWGVCNAFLLYWGVPDIVNGLLKTVLTGGVSMVVFFFIFFIIFPDNNAVARKAKKKYEKLVAANAPAERVADAEKKYKDAEHKALLSNTEKEFAKARSQASGKAMRYFAMIKEAEKAKGTEAEAEYSEKIKVCFADAVNAITVKQQKEGEFNAAKA